MGDIQVITAIKRPFTNISKLFLGAILLLIPILNLFSLGYLFNCIKEKHGLPNWNFKMILEGVVILALVFVYIIPFLIIFLFSYLIDASQSSLFILPFMFISAITFYFIPAAVVNFTKKQMILKDSLKFAFSKAYLAAFLIGLLWIAILNSLNFIAFKLLFFILPISLLFVVVILLSAVIGFASQITFLTLISNAHE